MPQVRFKFSQCDSCGMKIKFLSSASWNRLSTFPNHRSGKNLCSLSCSILRERLSYSHRQSFRQCLRYGENRRRRESSECNSGPSSDRGDVFSTDQGSGSATPNEADCRRHQTQVREEIVENVQIIPLERISECIVEQIFDEPVPQILGDICELVRLTSATTDGGTIVDVHIPQLWRHLSM